MYSVLHVLLQEFSEVPGKLLHEGIVSFVIDFELKDITS